MGMSSKEPKINSYTEFKEEMLPRIRWLGYNAIQIMAVQVRAAVGHVSMCRQLNCFSGRTKPW